MFNQSEVESVVVPDCFREFGFGVFMKCENLKKVVIENKAIQINSYENLGVFIDCPNVVVYCHKDSETYEALKKTHTGEIRFIEDEVSDAVETAAPAATPEVTNEHKWGSYEPSGTATITMKDGTVYNAVANSLILDSKKMKRKGDEELYDGIDTPDIENSYDLSNMKLFLEIASIYNKDGVFETTDDENQITGFTLPDDAQFWFITETTAYIPEKITAGDVASIVFDRTQTPNTDGLPYCTVYMEQGYFRTPTAFLCLSYNVSRSFLPIMGITHEFTPYSDYPTKINAIAKLEVTGQSGQSASSMITTDMVTDFRATMKNGEVVDFSMNNYYSGIYAMSKFGRIKAISESSILSIVFDADVPAAAGTPVPSPTPRPTPTENAAETRQGGNVLKADTLLGNSIYSAYTFPVFGSEIKRNQIVSITFLDTLSGAPEDAWDVSQRGDGAVLAWTVPNEEKYDLYIAGEGGVTAPENCKELFCGYMSAKAISFDGAFHTENVTDMSYMFHGDSHIKSLDLSRFTTQKVRLMNNMFYGCFSLTELDISSFDTSAVTKMDYMFFGTAMKELNLDHFDTANTVSMTCMFCGCDSLRLLDLSAFDLSNTSVLSMFQSCDQLETIILGKTGRLYSIKDMFANSYMLSDLYYGGTEEEWEASGIAAVLPEYVQVHFQADPFIPDVTAEEGQGRGVLTEDGITSYDAINGGDFPVFGSEITRQEVVSITFVDRLNVGCIAERRRLRSGLGGRRQVEL